MGISTIGGSCDCRCAAPCSDCCNSNEPTSFDVTFTLTDDYCPDCDTLLSGTFNCTKATNCDWEYLWTGSVAMTGTCSTASITRQYVRVRIQCVGNDIQLDIRYEYTIHSGIDYYATYTWAKTYSPHTNLDCTALSSEVIGAFVGTATANLECKQGLNFFTSAFVTSVP